MKPDFPITDAGSAYDWLHLAGVRLALNPDGVSIDVSTADGRALTDDEIAIVRHHKRGLLAVLRDREAGLFFEGRPGG